MDKDFTIDSVEKKVELSETGKERLAGMAGPAGGIWTGCRRREELVKQALAANYLYKRDRHYLVQDGKVLIIDENTGRVMADRSWERGLHQMIEIKENCEVTGQREHMARMTYQRFFRRYLMLSGMTGTAREVGRELWSVYHLPVVKVATHKPCRRERKASEIYRNKKEKWAAVMRRIHELHFRGRPVLVGTGSVAESEHLSRLLQNEGLAHQVLNARQDDREAEIVAMAGQNGCITIATNMAGRGTDIGLGAGVAKIGGLHIISTELNQARRIDRQLYGRCGRQGDPGSYQAILSLDDELPVRFLGSSIRNYLTYLLLRDFFPGRKTTLFALRRAQARQERLDLRLRRDLLQMDDQLGKLLAFSGRME
jgi:preprotein translocase subunit SecA